MKIYLNLNVFSKPLKWLSWWIQLPNLVMCDDICVPQKFDFEFDMNGRIQESLDDEPAWRATEKRKSMYEGLQTYYIIYIMVNLLT